MKIICNDFGTFGSNIVVYKAHEQPKQNRDMKISS